MEFQKTVKKIELIIQCSCTQSVMPWSTSSLRLMLVLGQCFFRDVDKLDNTLLWYKASHYASTQEVRQNAYSSHFRQHVFCDIITSLQAL